MQATPLLGYVRSPRSACGGSPTRRTTWYGQLPTQRNSILRPLLTADLARPRYRNPVAFRHNVAVSELPLRASRRPIGGW